VEVTVFVTDTRLRDLMSALWSLVSYRGAEWRWSRSGKPGAYRYQLMRPLPAATFAARVLQHSQERFEAEVATLLAAVNAPPERAAAIAARDPAAAKMLRGDRERAALKTFSETFSPETQLRILRGQALLKVPVSDLSPQGRAWVQSVWQQSNQSLPPGQWTHVPQYITAVAHPLPENVAPVLVMEIDGIGGYGYAGGRPLQNELDADLDRLWILPWDATDDPSAAQTLAEVSPPGPGEPALRPVERRLRDLASMWQGLFRIYHLFPQAAAQLISPAGLPVVDLLPAFERVPDPAVLRLLESGGVAAVRIVTETRRPQGGEAVWSVRLEMAQTDGQILPSSGYSYTLPRRRQSHREGSR
jgi:hypothetical protein